MPVLPEPTLLGHPDNAIYVQLGIQPLVFWSALGDQKWLVVLVANRGFISEDEVGEGMS